MNISSSYQASMVQQTAQISLLKKTMDIHSQNANQLIKQMEKISDQISHLGNNVDIKA